MSVNDLLWIDEGVLRKKYEAALQVTAKCLGSGGVWAAPTRYPRQCWTRDFVLAIMPVLFKISQEELVRKHLENLSLRQRPNGQIPILFLDGALGTLRFLATKIARSVQSRKLSFMLRRYLKGQLWNLTPGTRDSEILYVVGMYEYAIKTNDWTLLDEYSQNVRRAFEYIESNLMEGGLVLGCDWRDTMEKELGSVPLLTNNCLLSHAYRLRGDNGSADELNERINQKFWKGSVLMDHPGHDRFDPLGGALAVLYDVISPGRYGDIMECFRSVDSPCGVTIKCRHNPLTSEEAAVIDITDGEVVWPFVVGFGIKALLKMGAKLFATEQLDKLVKLDGFHEWYNPYNGRGYGAEVQLWSATLFIRAVDDYIKQVDSAKK